MNERELAERIRALGINAKGDPRAGNTAIDLCKVLYAYFSSKTGEDPQEEKRPERAGEGLSKGDPRHAVGEGACEHPGEETALVGEALWCSRCGAMRWRNKRNNTSEWDIPTLRSETERRWQGAIGRHERSDGETDE